MALVDRVKERVETDLSDQELGEIVAESQHAIRERWGPDRDPDNPLAVTLEGRCRLLDVARPIDITQPLEVIDAGTELAEGDYEVFYGGRILARTDRRPWGPVVKLRYVPHDDQAQRDEVAVKLAILSLTYRGLVKSSAVGDVQLSGVATEQAYAREREALLASLDPRGGLLIR